MSWSRGLNWGTRIKGPAWCLPLWICLTTALVQNWVDTPIYSGYKKMFPCVCPYAEFEQGGGELIFVTLCSNIFVVYESWCVEKPLCIVIAVDFLKRELLQSLIVSREYTYIEEINSLSINSFFFLFFFFSEQGQAQSWASSATYILWRDKIKNKTKKHNPLIWISHPFKVTYHKL